MQIADLMTIANLVMLISNIPSIRAVLKDRSIIAGYSVSGSFLTLLGMALIDTWYVSMGSDYYLPFFISLSTDAYWVLAFTFSFRRWLRKDKICHNKP